MLNLEGNMKVSQEELRRKDAEIRDLKASLLFFVSVMACFRLLTTAITSLATTVFYVNFTSRDG
jgi:multidrug transporter EmrE-like cation transporter